MILFTLQYKNNFVFCLLTLRFRSAVILHRNIIVLITNLSTCCYDTCVKSSQSLLPNSLCWLLHAVILHSLASTWKICTVHLQHNLRNVTEVYNLAMWAPSPSKSCVLFSIWPVFRSFDYWPFSSNLKEILMQKHTM